MLYCWQSFRAAVTRYTSPLCLPIVSAYARRLKLLQAGAGGTVLPRKSLANVHSGQCCADVILHVCTLNLDLDCIVRAHVAGEIEGSCQCVNDALAMGVGSQRAHPQVPDPDRRTCAEVEPRLCQSELPRSDLARAARALPLPFSLSRLPADAVYCHSSAVVAITPLQERALIFAGGALTCGFCPLGRQPVGPESAVFNRI